MAKEISIFDLKSYFQGKAEEKKKRYIEDEKLKAMSFLRNKFPKISDDDIEDIYQESLSALYINIKKGKLKELTCPFSSYFLQICNNQALKLVNKNKGIKTSPIIEDHTITNEYEILEEKVDELFSFCMTTIEEDKKVRLQLLVNNIIASMTDTCKNILHGYYWNDFTTSTIAYMYNFTSADSVKTQKYKCINKFREKFIDLKKKNKIYE